MKITTLIVRSRQALGWNQRQLGEHLGWSYRTVARWESGASHFDAGNVTTLARHVYPVDRDLSIELAATIGQTLVGLGFEAPPLPPAPVGVAPPTPYVHPTAPSDLVDAIVCAVADAANVSPRDVRPLVMLTLRRAFELRLDLGRADASGLFDVARVVPAASEAPVADGIAPP